MAPAKAAPFRMKWLDDVSWLVYDKSKDAAFCTTLPTTALPSRCVWRILKASRTYVASSKPLGIAFPLCLFIEHMRCARDLVAYGVDEVEFLRVIDAGDSNVALEYGALKQYVMCTAPQSSAMDFLTFVLTDSHVARMYPSILQLVTIAATLAPGSVDCERAFSLQNLVKTDKRTSLSASHLQDLMVCARDGPEASKLDVPTMMGEWIAAKEESNAKRRQL
ncbi:hypothetical protein SDRG_08555 [Saprolegnia diclina VS20]|uniref:HAT C-terminal dimerisation domain-containing protein n=1 Tax=Saprolegnia diclina (strain VS20) TaxID=1156394 RepID=T0Q7M0_SAPDV|nr:hypothetical protein SDRG_08555 [Saprolegnia diclina VS20]EQC33874.1 hypothetical protein SDRG_08555 [Saprolegnia diclina VS20]|eukprot:XP_008612669.1 hypothetical protein SDRG_08555 [Saprolegnia diclina VS20]